LAGFEGTLYGRFWVTPEALVDFGWTTTSKRPAAPMPSVTNRLGHPDAVLAKVESGFALIVPLEAHGSIVRTFCTYVKRVKSPESTCASDGTPEPAGVAGRPSRPDELQNWSQRLATLMAQPAILRFLAEEPDQDAPW